MATNFLHGVEVIEIDSGPRPIRTARTGVIGIVGTAPGADDAAFPLDTPVLISGSRSALGDLGTDGTLPEHLDAIFDQIGAVVLVVRVSDGASEAETMANVAGGVSPEGQLLGAHALLGAQSATGIAPHILIAPGFTHQRPVDPDTGAALKNPVAAEFAGLMPRLGAIDVLDAPDTTLEEAQAVATDLGNSRSYLIFPWGKVYGSEGEIRTQPLSARIAGVIARSDNDRGFWHSPSNQPIHGIIGLSQPVDFRLGDPNSRANLLNEANVATVINEGGYRVWGNRGTGIDPKYQFIQTRRIADTLQLSLMRSHLWAVDRNITTTYAEDVAEGVNDFIARLVEQGALISGRCWPDPDLNTALAIADGQVFFNFDYTSPYPAERIQFRMRLSTDGLEEIV